MLSSPLLQVFECTRSRAASIPRSHRLQEHAGMDHNRYSAGNTAKYGLVASWCVLGAMLKGRAKSTDSHTDIRRLQDLRSRSKYLHGSSFGPIASIQSKIGLSEQNENSSASYKGLEEGILIAMSGTCSFGRRSSKPVKAGGWTWKGVCFRPQDVAVPKLTETVDMLIRQHSRAKGAVKRLDLGSRMRYAFPSS